ncbi:MAG: hypothetical protein QXH71_00400 [Candidatus Anstonellaceae archaeon]
MLENKIIKYMFYAGLECCNKYKLAIPKIVVDQTTKKFGLDENTGQKELLHYAREICKKINKMSDLEINSKLKEIRDRRWKR